MNTFWKYCRCFAARCCHHINIGGWFNIDWWRVIPSMGCVDMSLQWRHNGRDGVSNHQPHDCLLNRLFRRRSKKVSKLRVTGLCEGNSPVTGEFPTQRASTAESVSIWWRHHVFVTRSAWCGLWYISQKIDELTVEILWNVSQVLMTKLGYNFAHITTAKLPQHEQNLDLMWLLFVMSEHKIWIMSSQILSETVPWCLAESLWLGKTFTWFVAHISPFFLNKKCMNTFWATLYEHWPNY